MSDLTAARASLAPLLGRYRAEPSSPDPWGVYFTGQSNEGFRMLDEMRRNVTSPPH